VRNQVIAVLVLSAAILVDACRGQAPPPAGKSEAPVAASTPPPAEPAALSATAAEPRALEDPQGTTSVLGDMVTQPVPPELAEHIPNFVIRLRSMWTPGQILRVCFLNGATALRQRIRTAAATWTTYGNITLDFGQPSSPRTCAPGQPSEIRIGFAYAGYWSLVGNTPVRGDLPTMNYGGFDTTPPAEPRFSGVVLHEFGHALGFEHEHQHPQGGCDTEFNWPIVYSELAKPPNRWSREKVDFNLRAFTDTSAYGVSAPDRTSIMHYSLDPWMFLNGERSTCYVREQYTLSELDKRGIATAYPAQADRMLGGQRNRIAQLTRTLPADAGAARRYLKDVGTMLDARIREISQRK